MTIEEVQNYFNQFKCEVLTSASENEVEIQSFSSKLRNNQLEGFLRDEAWQADKDGSTRVYVVREPANNKIVLFFSLKCGTTFTTHDLDDRFRELNSAERDYVKELVKARQSKNTDLFYQYIAIGESLFPEKHSLLIQIADHRYNSKNESHEVNDAHNVMKVDKCYASIELQHFCRCDDYKINPEVKFPLGFGLFWQIIVPRVLEIAKHVGCEYLYLFAADKSDNPEDKKLISYYKEALGFYDLDDEGVIVLKPGYDDDCVGLLQSVMWLDTTREEKWQEFSDHAAEL